MSSSDILKKIEDRGEEVRRLRVRRLGLFGSAVRGEDTAESDLDFVVEFEEKSFDRYMELKFFLEDLFGRPVDLVIAEALKPGLRSRILGETIYAQGF